MIKTLILPVQKTELNKFSKIRHFRGIESENLLRLKRSLYGGVI